jgi:hypothetical protein
MRDIPDLMLEAQANVTRRVSLLKRRFTMPILIQGFKKEWANLPDAMKEQFKRERPEQYQALMNLIQGDNNAN